MKRKDFIKTLAAACVAPVVAAKAIASSPARTAKARLYVSESCPNIIKAMEDYRPIHAYSIRKLTPIDIPHDPRVAQYDQSGNGNHAFLKDG